MRRYDVTDAAVHDNQAVDHLLMRGNTGAGVWADSAYRSKEMEAKLRHRTGQRQQSDQIHRAGPGRTCLRCADQQHGQHAGAHDQHGAGEGQDRDEEPGL